MSFPDVKTLLPHRDPILLVDRITAFDPGKSIRTEFTVRNDMSVFAGHFPGNPVLPGVYSIEAMTQTGVCLLMADDHNQGKAPLFLGVNNARFFRPIVPGDILEMTAEIVSIRKDKPVCTLKEEVRVKGELAAACEAVVFLKS